MKKRFKELVVLVLCVMLAFAGQGSAEEFGWPTPGHTYILQWNVPGHSCRYGYNALDISVPVGTEVFAAADGTVITCKELPGDGYGGYRSFGKYIEIKHSDGNITLYAHLNDFNVYQRQQVKRGDLIAWSGNLGNTGGTPHLHYEMSKWDIGAYYRTNGYRDPRYMDSTPPKVTSTPNKNLTAGYYYSLQCEADGDVSSWSVEGPLPPGMSINSSTGEIYGTPSHTEQGKASYWSVGYSFTVVATNSAGSSRRSANIQVYEPPVITTDNRLADGKVGQSYSQGFYADGTELGMSWKVKSGTIPPGLTFSHKKDSRVPLIEGTPTQSGTYQFTLELQNSSTASVTKTFTLIVSGSYPESGMWIDGSFKDWKHGEYYLDRVKLTFRSSMYFSRWVAGSTVSVIDGELPPGLRLSWATGASGIDDYVWSNIYLSGTPSKTGTYEFTIRATNGLGGYTDSKQKVIISSNRPYLDSSMSILFTFIKGKFGVSYNDYVITFGGTAPFTVEKTLGSIPPGLELENDGGRIIRLRGIPTRTGTYTFTLKATGAHNGYATKTFTLNIAANSAYSRAGVGEDDEDNPTKPKLATKKIPNATTYSEYNVTFEAGGTTPITWSYTGDLPEGFVFTDTGTLFGVPTEEGRYKFRVTATNSQGSVSKSFTLKVLPQKPSITTMSLPDGAVGQPYSFTLEADGDSIKWSKSGKLPKGLKLNKTTGELSGTPTEEGTYTFSIKAKNKAGKDTAEFQMVINKAIDSANSVTASAMANGSQLAVRHNSEAINTTELYLMNDGQELDDDLTVNAGTPLTFRAGDPDDEADYSSLKVYVNDEETQGVKVSSNGMFTIPGSMVQGKFTVYAADDELETSELDVDASSETQEVSPLTEDSSGGCSVNLAGMLMLIMSGAILFRKK